MDNTVLIGIGNAGCKILSKINIGVEKLFLNTDKFDIERYSGLCIGLNTCKGISAGGNTVRGELAARENKSQILDILDKFANWIVIAPMGGGTSCGTTKKIIDYGLDNNKSLKIVTSVPFDWEGNRRRHIAIEALTYAETLCDTVTIKFNTSNIPKNASMNDLFNLMDKQYIETIKAICVKTNE